MEKFYLGLDLGGTYFRAVTCDVVGNNTSEITKVKLIRRDNIQSEIEINLFKLIDDVCSYQKKGNKNLAGIGIAMAAMYDRNTGKIFSWSNNNKWNNYPIYQKLTERYNVPIVIEDDANAAALGEKSMGAAKEVDSFVYVTISTGIGSGIVMNNHLLTGKHGWAGDFGHIKVSDEDVVCSCGAKGCLQAMASGPAIVKKFKKISKLKGYDINPDIDLKDIAEMANQGIQEAVDLFKEAGTYIGNALANLVILLDVPIIVLGGGVLNVGFLILDSIKESFQQSLGSRRNAKIILSSLGDNNGLIGSLSLIDEYIKSRNKFSM